LLGLPEKENRSSYGSVRFRMKRVGKTKHAVFRIVDPPTAAGPRDGKFIEEEIFLALGPTSL